MTIKYMSPENHGFLQSILSSIQAFDLDLRGMSVLTEAGSNAFMCTALAAAQAGATKVYALCKDSEYASSSQVKREISALSNELGTNERIQLVDNLSTVPLDRVNLLTNTGHLRPIRSETISRLPKLDAAIPLMWETWEFRPNDLDLNACIEHKVPVLGTEESDRRVGTLHAVGELAFRLLRDHCRPDQLKKVGLVSSGKFRTHIIEYLQKKNIEFLELDVTDSKTKTEEVSSLLIAEHESDHITIGEHEGLQPQVLAKRKVPIVHISGRIDYNAFDKFGLKKYPEKRVDFGQMTVTTAYIGPEPVIRLHTAGLKVGEALIRGLREHKDLPLAIEFAMKNSPAQNWQKEIFISN